jgi:hypothetical protein
MKKHHTTIVLAILFCTGLFVLWWADHTELDRDVSDLVLPALAPVPAAEIKRLDILGPASVQESSEETSGTGRMVFERRDEGRWQMLEPLDVAADPSVVESLAQNLKALRRSPEAGTIHDPPKNFGLQPPATIVRFYGGDLKKPLGALEVGRSIREQLYVRPEGSGGIEVVNPRLLSMLKLTPAQWRDKALFHLPSFRVGVLSVKGPGRDLTIERDEGHWRLVRPLRAVAESDKVEGIVAELTSLQVAKGVGGFVAHDVKDGDAAKYGLDRPEMTIELRPAGPGKPQILLVGKPEAENSDRRFARVGGHNDVVLIDAKNLRDLGVDPVEYRSKKVAELTEARVEFLRVEAFGRPYDIARTATGWEQVRPTRELAEATAIKELLSKLGEAQTSEFLDPAAVPQPGIDPPAMTIFVWQAGPLAKPALGLDAPPQSPPRVVLQIGRVDASRKVVYARLEGDTRLLAIPDTIVDALPRSPVAFRDRTVLRLSPAQILRLTINRPGATCELVAPTEAGKSVHWRMVQPVSARADDEAVTRATMLLSSLRAERYVTDQVGDGKPYGLHVPVMTVTWEISSEAAADKAKGKTAEPQTKTGTLRIGAKLPKPELSYANIEGSPLVFTLPDDAIRVFEAEFHNRRVLSFPPAAAHKLVLRWPARALAFKTQESRDGKGPVRWVPEADSNAAGFDVSRLQPLVATLANLVTPRFLQYTGPIPATTGLDAPQLVIEVQLGGDKPETRVLRIGHTSATETLATTATKASGPVFLLTGPSWSDLAKHVPGGTPLPENVFAPNTGKPPGGDAKASPP